jgi:CRISPR-associated endonuclease Csn1
MKRILGLDLGTTSIGWALVNEGEKEAEKSKIIRTGVRVIPLSSDESSDFSKGKSSSINADRTLKRGARRSLQRYKQRRENLNKVLLEHNLISNEFILNEEGKESTHSLWKLRANAAQEEILLSEFARVLFSINKKRGYKSNRKAKDENDGQAIDGMEVALNLYNENITPGQYVFNLLINDKKSIPDFYRSDLQNEFDKIWNYQKRHYPEILSSELKDELLNKNKGQTYKICEIPFDLVGVKRLGNKKEQKKENYQWRALGLSEKLSLEQLVVVFQEINNQKHQSSGYLGAISDRSKELYFNKETVGQYLYNLIKKDPNIRLKSQVFYRQDYLDEFEKIWDVQSKFHKELTNDLKKEVRDIIIFYQRRLKSQKGLINVCELEGREIELSDEEGKIKKKRIGPKVVPKSSPLFQEYKIWQILNNIEIRNIKTKEIFVFNDDTKQDLFKELNSRGKLSNVQLLKIVVDKPREWELNYKDGIEGNETNSSLYSAYKSIAELSGHDVVNYSKMSADEIKSMLRNVFDTIGVNSAVLDFNSELDGKEYENQKSYQLWHLLYSFEGDNSKTGHDKLYQHLKDRFGFEKEYAQALVGVSFKEDYGSLSSKAIKRMMPYLKEGKKYSEAAKLAGYNHSHSLTKEENQKRDLKETLELLPKNSLRNPIVEKILNQMVNVVNTIIKEYGKPDEIRIELARELKKSAKERAEMTSHINSATKINDGIKNKLKEFYPFNTGVRITKNDIIKYKLYNELATNGYKTIYTNTYVDIASLFTKEFDIEHIIPKAVLFDDSFSNKTISKRDFNRIKSSKTGIDAIVEKYGEGSKDYNRYISTIEKLYNNGNGVISRAKYNKLLMKGSNIPDGFIERDLRNTQYISKRAKEMLQEVFRKVTPITGIVTSKLRDDWQLVNVLQELNWDKYKMLGLTKYEINKDGKKIPRIIEWTKRNDHRHHAMDALTVAFTKHNHIQYYNYLNARKDEQHKQHSNIYAIEQKETFISNKDKRLMKPPIPINELRAEAKNHLEKTLISFKTKNKVVTRNKNKTKKRGGINAKIELTPRGQLHKETVYGTSKIYKTKLEKVGPKFNRELIESVAQKSYKTLLLSRLSEFDDDPKKAFSGKNSLSKNPIWLDKNKMEKLPEKVKLVWQETQFTIRKEITPDLKIEKVVDKGARRALQSRLDEYGGKTKEAFTNLEENPIWLNKEKGIKLKRVKITGVSNAEDLHNKKDHFGVDILDHTGKSIPTDFVSTGNNHHVAIYRDEKGKLHEKVVSFYEAVIAVNNGLDVIDRNYNSSLGWEFLFTMKQNEMFVFPNEKTGFNPKDIDLMDEENYNLISPNLFRVQKFTIKDYFFRHHFETTVENKKETKSITWKREGLSGIKGIIKVRLNHLGKIAKVGE